MTRPTTITLYGNVGADPETRTFAGRERTYQHRDRIIDDLVERTFTTPDRDLTTFSLATTERAASRTRRTRWVRCDDWNHLARAALVRRGDRLRLRGHFRTRTVEKDGQTRVFESFIVEDLQVERRKVRQRAA